MKKSPIQSPKAKTIVVEKHQSLKTILEALESAVDKDDLKEAKPLNEPPAPFEERYPEFVKPAHKIVNMVLQQVTTLASGIQSEMPYKDQGLLELIIKMLNLHV